MKLITGNTINIKFKGQEKKNFFNLSLTDDTIRNSEKQKRKKNTTNPTSFSEHDATQ